MAVQDATTLKGYFNTGDVPTEAQFADLIDSTINTGLQATLVSGTNIKTINSTSLLGSGNIAISGTNIPYQNDAPTSPSDGDLWIDKDAIASSDGSLLVAEIIVGSGTSSGTTYYVGDGSAVTSVAFSGLDGNAGGGYSLEAIWINGVSQGDIQILVNSDSSATGYKYQYFIASGGLTYLGQPDNSSSICAGAVADSPMYANVSINNVGGYFQAFSNVMRKSILTAEYGVCKYAATISNITTVTLKATVANSIGIGSIFRLYKRR